MDGQRASGIAEYPKYLGWNACALGVHLVTDKAERILSVADGGNAALALINELIRPELHGEFAGNC
ncbi:MAG TPA: hypothetical protein VFA12_20345 [Stellaceae bacterium]|nr:hypothetical protein [Stellaceae bacterium]